MNDDTTKKTKDEAEETQEEASEFVELNEDGEELSVKDQTKKLREKLAKAVEEKQEYLTNWQKDKAEFINARKRDDEAKAEYLKFASAKVIEDILPVLDSFDMAMGNKTAWESVSKEWKAGIESIYNQLLGALSKHSVTAYGAVGDAFDPNLHHSIATVPVSANAKPHTVAEVLQKGYLLNGKELRPALVKVFE